MRQVIQHERDEHVIGVVGFRVRVRGQHCRLDLRAHGLAAVERRLCLRTGLGLGLVVAGMFGVEPRVNQLFLLHLDRT